MAQDNEVLQSLHHRKSVRAFEKTPVTAEEKEAIYRAACAAPTAGNQQLYTIIDITREDVKKWLGAVCDNQAFIASAPMVSLFCADHQKWMDIYRQGGLNPRPPGLGDFILAVQDTLIAAQNAVIAAESLGLGSCYIGDIMERGEQVREKFALPPHTFPATLLIFGVPTEGQKKRLKPPRSPLELVVHADTYHPWNRERLQAFLGERVAPKDYERWVRAFCNRKYHAEFALEMNRSVEAHVRIFKESK